MKQLLMPVNPDAQELLAALVALADECNGKLGRNPYGVPAYKAACIAAGRAVGSEGDWMDGIDHARSVLEKKRGK